MTEKSGETVEATMTRKVVEWGIIALLGWQTYTTYQMSIDLAVVKTKLETAALDRFTDADGLLLEQRIEANTNRLNTLEDEVGLMR